jgi:putative hydrolase of the HAD superfamily
MPSGGRSSTARALDRAASIIGTMRFRAVFFDVGETLVHPHPSYPELFAQVVERAGHPRSAEDVSDASRVVLRRFSEAARDGDLWTTSPELSRAFWTSVYEHMIERLELPTGDGLADDLYTAFTDRSNYVLFEDVVPMIDTLVPEVEVLGIVSNFEAWLEELLVDLGVRDRFPVRVISGVEGVEKPDPRIYEMAMRRAGVEPADVAYVGDNPEFDVDPPAALGMFPVLVDRRGRHEGFAGTRITDLRELAEVLA